MNARDFVAAIAVAALSACSSSTGPSYNPDIPAAWATAVTNPYFPLPPGTVWRYRSDTPDGLETTITEVLSTTRTINRVVATAVHDQVLLDGALIEDTEDWYAQDPEGNVWYLGENTREYEDGQVVSTAGSWEWGVNGALPGIIMWADPAAHVGEEYRQEFARGEAEDFGKVVALDQSVTVPHGGFTGCLKTEDWNGLEPAVREYKYYCPVVGTVLESNLQGEDRVELTDVTAP
ncbi:MAG TPA: hypothetical protein VF252_10450 [Gemmatimonadales bacterium]